LRLRVLQTGKDRGEVVGATGFEPATPCAQGRCATRLRYAPTEAILRQTIGPSGLDAGPGRLAGCLSRIRQEQMPAVVAAHPAMNRSPKSL
jgi:hypothetical protein